MVSWITRHAPERCVERTELNSSDTMVTSVDPIARCQSGCHPPTLDNGIGKSFEVFTKPSRTLLNLLTLLGEGICQLQFLTFALNMENLRNVLVVPKAARGLSIF